LEWCCHKPRNTKDCQQPAEVRRGEEFFPGAFTEMWTCGHLDYFFSSSFFC
jgi:hypothetical protein